MKTEIEREKKSLLTKEQYLRILNNIESFSFNNIIGLKEDFEIIDTYFDDQKRSLKNDNSIIRIRNLNGIEILNYKKKLEDKSSLEKELEINKGQINLDEMIFKNFDLKVNNIFEIANYKIQRTKINYGNVELFLDNVIYNNINEDYELEVEGENFEVIDEFLEKFFDYFKLSFTYSKPKIARYFEHIKENREFKINLDEIILVVEGKSDYDKIRSVYKDLNIFMTNGLGLKEETIDELESLSLKYNKKVVILTDPDVPGEIIRNRISKKIKGVYHIYVNKDLTLKKKNIGIENLSKDQIRSILSQKVYESNSNKFKYTTNDLINIGIYNDKEKRLEFCKEHNIAYGNNKKVLRQINEYQISIY